MKKNKNFGDPLKVTTPSSFILTVLEFSTIKTSAANPLLEQWVKEIGVLFSPIILHKFDLLVQLFDLLVQTDKIEQKNKLESLAWVGGAV